MINCKTSFVVLTIMLFCIIPCTAYDELFSETMPPLGSFQIDYMNNPLTLRVNTTYFSQVSHVDIQFYANKDTNISGNYPFRLKRGVGEYYGNGTVIWSCSEISSYSALCDVSLDITDFNPASLTGHQNFALDGVPFSGNWIPKTYRDGTPNAIYLRSPYAAYLTAGSNYIPNGTYSSFSGAAYNPVTGTPQAEFECNNDWRGEPAPFDLACVNNGYNYTTQAGGCSWTVYYPDDSTQYSDSDCSGFTDLTLQPGIYDVGLQLCNDNDECDFELKTDYVLVLGGLITPNVTPTIYPNVTQIPLIPTLSPTLMIIINRSDYRSTIEETLIGNITAPYLDFMDDWAESWIDWVDQFSNQVNWPLITITELIEDVLEHVQDSFDDQFEKAQIFMYWTGAMLIVIPASVWALINYKLLIEILKAFLET